MRRLFWCELWLFLLAGMAAAAQVDNSNQNVQLPGSAPGDSATPPGVSETPTTSTTIKPDITVTGKVPRAEQPLPTLPPDELSNCYERLDSAFVILCNVNRDEETHIVREACVNPSGNAAPLRVIQACTELLDRKIIEDRYRFAVFANRAKAFFGQGDEQRALDDYNEAIKLAPRNAILYFSRGAFYEAQSDYDAALQDFETAIGIKPKLVPALRQRAKLYQTRGNFSGAFTDYSEAIRLQPKTAALWSERGYVSLRQHDYESALKDEARAIQLDPKLARAYFLRSAAFGDLGDSRNAVSDLVKAVDLDPSLDRYVTREGKTATITLPLR